MHRDDVIMFYKKTPATLISASDALPGRATSMPGLQPHYILGTAITPPFAEHLTTIELGLGCFWGAERKFWTLSGVHTTAVGYAGGFTPNPNYEEVCTGATGHTEAVLVVYDENTLPLAQILRVFFESHNPTQGMRQGNDIGSQYRSAIYTHSEAQLTQALEYKARYQQALSQAGFGAITTEIRPAQHFYYAEDYHQQYLAKNPNGYCGLGGTGVGCE